MSGTAVGWVWKYSPMEKSGLLVHLALADVTNDMHGNQLWCSVATVSAKTRLDRTTVMTAFDALVERGLLAERPRPGRTTLYQFRTPDLPVVFSDTPSDWDDQESDTPVGESDRSGRKSRHELNRTQSDNYAAPLSENQCTEWLSVAAIPVPGTHTPPPTVARCILTAGHSGACEPRVLVPDREDLA